MTDDDQHETALDLINMAAKGIIITWIVVLTALGSLALLLYVVMMKIAQMV